MGSFCSFLEPFYTKSDNIVILQKPLLEKIEIINKKIHNDYEQLSSNHETD